MTKNKPQEIAESNILPRVNYHFGYSVEEDEIVSSSDNIQLKPHERIIETYKYETIDKKETMQNIFNNLVRASDRLNYELSRPVQNQKVIARCREIIKNGRDMVLRDRAFIEKQMGLDVAFILSRHTL